jgi:predicted esterase
MSLLTGLTNERKLGGVVVMSSWLPLKSKFKAVSCDLYIILLGHSILLTFL